nr:hypothetical protein Itr_chr12CG01430 [Ipomoea trifida]
MDFFTLPSVDSISSLTNALLAVCIVDLFAVLAFALYRSRYISNIVCYMFLWNTVQIAKSVLDKAYPYTTFVVINQLMINICATVYWGYRLYQHQSLKVFVKFWLWSFAVFVSLVEMIMKLEFLSVSQFVKFDKWFSIVFVVLIILQDVLIKMLDIAVEKKKPPYLRQTEEKFRDLVDEVMAEVENSASNGHLRRRFHNKLREIYEEALVVEA